MEKANRIKLKTDADAGIEVVLYY